MEMEQALLTIPINPNNFPAKLWRLVNDPHNSAIRWDVSGEGVVIHQKQFEAELLSPPPRNPFETVDLFKTTNFTSFIRQLNLYGFRKVIRSSEKQIDSAERLQHHFQNRNFKRCHPELLVNLKRLTSSNKAKIEAGLEVSTRQPNRFRRLMANGSGLVGQVQRSPPHPCHPSRSQSVTERGGTPVPPWAWLTGSASSPPAFHADKGIPRGSVIHRFPPDGVQSNPTPLRIQQGAQQRLFIPGQKCNPFVPHHPQYRPRFYSPAVCQCCPPSSMDHDISAHQTPASYYSYYQPNCPVGFFYPGNQNQNWPGGENQDTQKNDVSLDAVFQIVDELQAPPKIHTVKLETPEKLPRCACSPADQPVSPAPRGGPAHVTPRVPILIGVAGNAPQEVAVTVGEPREEEPQTVTQASDTIYVEAHHKEEQFGSSEVEELLDIEVSHSLHDPRVTQDSSNTWKKAGSPAKAISDVNMFVEVSEGMLTFSDMASLLLEHFV